MKVMSIVEGQIMIADFSEKDREEFVRYQNDPRYRSLYDFAEETSRPNALFEDFLNWQHEQPRQNFQLGIYEARSGRLLGCGGLRRAAIKGAVLGIELAPSEWGRYRRAIDATCALLSFGFDVLDLDYVIGDTASGNNRIEKLARWFGAEPVANRDGPAWMKARGWREVDWLLSQSTWRSNKPRRTRTQKGPAID